MIKANKTFGLLRKLQNVFRKRIKLQLGCGYVGFDKACNNSFDEKLQNIQYNASHALNGKIKGLYKGKLGLESFQCRSPCRKLYLFYKNSINEFLVHL